MVAHDAGGGAEDLAALRDLAVEVAHAAGEVLLARRGDIGGVEAKGRSNDLVSAADRESEALVGEELARRRPDDGLLGEEGASRQAPSGLRWVVDPIDGTTNYLYGLDAWTVSIALQRRTSADWESVVGVVHQPVTGETFEAVAGGGAWLGARRLAVNDPVALPEALVATGFAYDPADRARQARTAAHLLVRTRDLRRLGSAALDLCLVAAGRVDGFYEDHLEVWDAAAGELIAAEAGAVVTRLGRGLLAAGPALHPRLAAAVDEGRGGAAAR